jgi:hypothetical protein
MMGRGSGHCNHEEMGSCIQNFSGKILTDLGTSRRRLEGHNNLDDRELICAEMDAIELQYVPWHNDFAWPDDDRLYIRAFLSKILRLVIYG